MKILFVGALWTGSNALSLANGFAENGHRVVGVDTRSVNFPRRFSPAWFHKRLSGNGPISRLHHKIARTCESFAPDLLVCFKTVGMRQDELLSLPIPVKIHYSPDDASNPVNITPEYLKYEQHWDLVVTTKSFNVQELLARGARNVQFVWSAYDPAWHHRTAGLSNTRYRLGFIGRNRPDRAPVLRNLGRQYGSSMIVGGGSELGRGMKSTSVTRCGSIYGEALSELIGRIDTNLVFLNSDNRDLHTCRSFEVPAAGGLVLGQRTPEHAMIFAEDHEALFFDSDEELYDKLDWIDHNGQAARRIAEAGHRAVVSGLNSYANRAEEILSRVDAHSPNTKYDTNSVIEVIE